MRTSGSAQSVRGYAEGYYGRLLSWYGRARILDALQALSLNTYYYAPKEDPCHRLQWRAPYSAAGRVEFRDFCKAAAHRGITVVAGVAPGLDFNFSHLPDGRDFSLLVAKACELLDDGATAISLLMDDIDADFDKRRGDFASEGQAHATLANALANALVLALPTTSKQSIWVAPRIYADELIPEAPEYLPDFLQTLDEHHAVLYCGSDVVAHTLDASSFSHLHTPKHDDVKTEKPGHRIILWDNLYANDYCPRRLFVGPWQGRGQVSDVLLNPTGMVYTDCLLLELMADGLQHPAINPGQVEAQLSRWRRIMKKHGVPNAFFLLAPYFNHPVFNAPNEHIHRSDDDTPEATAALMAAIEECLWRWKSPLSREWYPAIFGLKHDLLTQRGEHSAERIRKTQSAPLARLLTKDTGTSG